VTATAGYTLTQADLDAGIVSNTATVTGTPPHGPAVLDKDTFDLPLVNGPAISLVKTGVVHGDTITFTFVVTNTGNVSLTSVLIADELRGLSAITYDAWPNAQGELAPGASVMATATYVVTDADKSAGFVSNEASVTATPPTGPEITARDGVRVTLKSVGALAHTGVDSDRLRGVVLFSLLTIIVGAAALFIVRRKRT